MSACPTCGAGNPPRARFCNSCGARLEGAADEPRELSGERRVVTIVFCDVRGSTSMAEGLDPEDWTDVMNETFEHLIQPVYRYEGTVARLMGDAILAFFGAPNAHEDDPQRAVMAGLEIVASIAPLRERLAREQGLDLNVRVGINTGSVVVGEVGSELRREYSAMGDAVNVAARMEQTAEPGTVQITEDTYRLVADLFDVDRLGEVELKGKRRPVPAYRVIGRRSAAWKVRAARSLEAPLVGRDSEMAILRSALEEARRDRGSIVLIAGDPGIGKSRLVEETIRLWVAMYDGDHAPSDLWQCVPYDAMQPYAQYRRLIQERSGITETDPPEVVRNKLAGLVPLAPEGWGERSERVARALLGVELEGEPRLEGEAFHDEATQVFVGTTLASRGPRLLVFEDLHWCDQASLELVREAVRSAEEAPLACVISFRPDPSAASWGFAEWIENERGHRCTVIDLHPLSKEQSGQLIDGLLPIDLGEDARRGILARTEGNPLFVQEVARALIDRGVVHHSADGWRLVGDAAEVTIPDSVQSLITVSLDRLPERARRTLQAASVIGRTFDEEVLLAVEDGGGDARADLAELERRDLIRTTGDVRRSAYTFRHALTQEAAYGSLLIKRRRALHRRVAGAIEATAGERLEEVAPFLVRHFGEAGDDESTLRYAVMAGDAAARLYANAEAAAHYGTALDAAHRVGSESSLLRSLYERRGSVLELAGRHDEAIAGYEEMLSDARASKDAAMELAANSAIALLYSTASPMFDPERGRRLSEEIVGMARALGDRAAEARALWNIVVASVYGGGDASQAVEAGEASLAIARELGDRAQLAFTLNDVSRAHMAAGDFSAAAERLEEARGLWESLDNLAMLGENLTLGSLMRLLAGDHAGAISEATTAASLAESIGNRWGESFALISIYRAQLDLAEFGRAMESIERCRERGELGGFAYAGIATRADLARASVRLGDAARALPLADRALELAREQAPSAMALPKVARSDALLELGDERAARAALEGVDVMLLPEPDRTFSLVWLRLAEVNLSMAAGDADQTAEALEGVVGHLRSNGVRILVAECLLAVARARIAQGLREQGFEALTEAIQEAERLGERMALWSGVALMAEMRAGAGAPEEASELKRRARRVVEEIAAGIADENLRRSFLARKEVVAVRSVER